MGSDLVKSRDVVRGRNARKCLQIQQKRARELFGSVRPTFRCPRERRRCPPGCFYCVCKAKWKPQMGSKLDKSRDMVRVKNARKCLQNQQKRAMVMFRIIS